MDDDQKALLKTVQQKIEKAKDSLMRNDYVRRACVADAQKSQIEDNYVMSLRLLPMVIFANELGKLQLLENKKAKAAQWSAEKRATQSVKINNLKPWLKSTGPKTREGKWKSAQNAYIHAGRSIHMRRLLALMRYQKQRLRLDYRGNFKKPRLRPRAYATQSAMTRLKELIDDLHAHMKSRGANISRGEVRKIVKEVTGLSESDFITLPNKEISQLHAQQSKDILERRMKGEPLTRILGVREFWGLEFEVTPDVLDPRPDTETLVERALRWIKQNYDIPSRPRACVHGDKQISILDLGTGTGCIPIVLLSEMSNAKAMAVDKSPEALKVARRNAEKYKMSDRIEFVQSDWFESIKDQEFDLIVSNPPYIAESVIENLEVEVKNHDPILALSGGESGLDCYKKIISGLKSKLNEQNRAFLEIGYDQRKSVSRLVDDSNLRVVACHQDLAGHDRVLEISICASGDK